MRERSSSTSSRGSSTHRDRARYHSRRLPVTPYCKPTCTNPNQTISQPYLNPISTLSQPYPQPYPPTLSCQLWPPNLVPQPLRLAMAPNLWRHSVVPPCGAALLHPSAAPPCCTTVRRHSAAVPCGTLCGSALRWHPAAAGWCSQLWQHPVPRAAAALCAGRTVAANTGAECPPPSARGELWM